MFDLKKWIAKASETLQALAYTNSQTVYGDYCKVERVGRIVNVVGQSTDWSIPQRQYRSLATLPTWARPTNNIVATVEAYGGQNFISIMITPNGLVQLYSTGATSYWRYNVTYIVGGGST